MNSCKFSNRASARRRCEGSGLIIVMFVIAVVSAFIGLAMIGTSGTVRIGGRAQTYFAVETATDGAVEHAYGVWKARAIALNKPPTTTQANATLTAPTFTGFSYGTAAENGPLKIAATDEYGAPLTNKNVAPTRVYTDLTDYPGWRGFASTYLISAKMRATSGYGKGAVAGVKRLVEYVQVPLFQSMFFFEGDLSIVQPAEMILGGLIHTNSNLYLSGSQIGSLTVGGAASYAGTYSDTTDPPYIDTWGPWWPEGKLPPIYPDGQAEQLSRTSRYEPLGTKPSEVLDTTDANPNNDSFRELIEPPVNGFPDPPEIAQRRLFNKAGIEMEIKGATVTVRTRNGTTLNPARVSDLKAAYTGTSAIYDQREGKTITVANIDMGKVTDTLDKGGVKGFNGLFYVHDTTPATTDPNPKAVRLQNGGELPDGGLTVASQNPVYIQGDYNTGTTTDPNAVPANATGNPDNTDSSVVPGYTRQPAAVAADAVMLLSNNWNDANASLPLGSRVASNTTYNTAILAGFMPSGWTPPSGAQYGYSGGAINFARFLETWDNHSCTYYGSMVELFESKVFTGEWDTGNIYAPPKRRWNYDPLFSSTPPPGSVDAVVLSRGTWANF